MNKLGQGFNTAEQDLDPDALSRESDALPLSQCALECECVHEFFFIAEFVAVKTQSTHVCTATRFS